MLHLLINSTERGDSPRYLVCHPTPRDRWYIELWRALGGIRIGTGIAGQISIKKPWFFFTKYLQNSRKFPDHHQWRADLVCYSVPVLIPSRAFKSFMYQWSRGVGWQTRYPGLSTHPGESIERCSINYQRVVTTLIRCYIKKHVFFH